ncbi:hypothetical protein UlMin_008992 [Ulmus minor]
MQVTDKCDVYSFGVVALEVMIGRHSGEMLESLLVSSRTLSKNSELLLVDVLNQRLPPPARELVVVVVFLVTLALACKRPNPDARPNMHFVAQELSARTQTVLTKPFQSISMNKLTSYHK